MSLADRFDISPAIYIGQIASAYPAIQKELNRKVLLKVIHPQWSRDKELIERFKREGEAIARLNSPNIVKIYDLGWDEGIPYLVLEWIDGKTVAQLLEDGPMSQSDVIHLAYGALKGLSAVHGSGLIHRDIKPDNILLDSDRQVKLADFSLAGFGQMTGLTSHGAIVGSPGYIAPELLDGSPATPQSDLFGLGVVLYQSLTGSNPFFADDPVSSLNLVKTKSIPSLSGKPNIDRNLSRLIDRLLQRHSDDRIGSADDALKLLDSKEISGSIEIVKTDTRNASEFLKKIALIIIPLVVLVLILIVVQLESNHELTDKVNIINDSLKESEPIQIDRKVEDSLSQNIQTFDDNLIGKLEVNTVKPKQTINFGELVIFAEPWATVSIDDSLIGITPISGKKLREGIHRIQFHHSNFTYFEKTVYIHSDQRDTIRIDFRRESATLSISAMPWGLLWINGDSVGLLPREESIWLKPGSYLISIFHPQLDSWHDSISVSSGEAIEMKVDMISGTMVAFRSDKEKKNNDQ